MICIPIAAPSTDAAIEKMERASHLADLIELRVDRIAGVDLGRLLEMRRRPVIVTNRRREEGGDFAGTEAQRIDLLKQAVTLGAEYVDIEASTESSLRSSLRKAMAEGSTQLIVSWHDFSGTPSTEVLRAKLRECISDGPAIAKIVTFAKTAADCLRLLDLIPYAQQRGHKIISFCMGKRGKISRIMAPLLGAVLSYACLEEEEASAPGQLTVHQMQEIYRIMDKGE